jgi:hypothetical protein
MDISTNSRLTNLTLDISYNNNTLHWQHAYLLFTVKNDTTTFTTCIILNFFSA